jgi:hypothetical protein
MQRRQFLAAAAIVAEFPAIDALGCLNQQPAGDTAGRWLRQDDDKAGLQECDICGGEKPAEMVSRTTLPEIAPLQADVCWVCEFSHEHTPAEGVCHECGECLNGGGFSIEIEYPLGVADLPARKTATLCGDCAEWTASDITHRGVGNDDVAGPRLGRLIDEEAARLRDLEAADE